MKTTCRSWALGLGLLALAASAGLGLDEKQGKPGGEKSTPPALSFKLKDIGRVLAVNEVEDFSCWALAVRPITLGANAFCCSRTYCLISTPRTSVDFICSFKNSMMR